MRVLVIEDHELLADGIARALSQAGMTVDLARDGVEADDILAIQDFDLVVLDLNLPGMDGLDVLRQMRGRGNHSPVLILTARGELEDRVKGLDLGADDYLRKPFELAELEARARALVRRRTGQRNPVLRNGPLELDTVAMTACLDGTDMDLPRRELSVLQILLSRCGQVVSKDAIADQLANFDDAISPNAVELYISRLRKRLDPGSISIKTVRGLGYLMEKK